MFTHYQSQKDVSRHTKSRHMILRWRPKYVFRTACWRMIRVPSYPRKYKHHIVMLRQMSIGRVNNAESEKIITRQYCRANRPTSRNAMPHNFLSVNSNLTNHNSPVLPEELSCPTKRQSNASQLPLKRWAYQETIVAESNKTRRKTYCVANTRQQLWALI